MQLLEALLFAPRTWRTGWEPAYLAPTAGALATICAYLVAALLAALAGAFAAHGVKAASLSDVGKLLRARLEARAWVFIALVLLALSFARLVDLGNLVAGTARFVVRQHGWYERRRPFQVAVSAALAVVALFIAARVRRWALGGTRALHLALVGLVMLLAFAAIRDISWHNIDTVLGMRVAGLRVSWLLEGGIVACIAGASAVALLLRLAGRARDE